MAIMNNQIREASKQIKRTNALWMDRVFMALKAHQLALSGAHICSKHQLLKPIKQWWLSNDMIKQEQSE